MEARVAARDEKRAIADLLQQGQGPIRLPTPDETAARALRFEEVLLADPIRGREELRRLFENGQVLLRPQPEGFYLAEGKLFPLALFSLRLDIPQTPLTSASRGLRSSSHCEPAFSCSSDGCAGRI